MAGYQITIDGIDYTAYVIEQSITSNDSVEIRGEQCSFDIRIENNEIASPFGQTGAFVYWYDDGIKIYGGQLAQVTPSRKQAPTNGLSDVWYYACRCVDFTLIMDKYLVKKIYAPGQAAETIVLDILANYTDGRITNNNVATGAPGMPEFVFDYISVSQAIDQIARTAGWRWHLDYDMDLHFFAFDHEAAPIPELLVDTETRVYDIKGPTEDITQERNRLFVKDFKLLAQSPYTEVFVADGKTRFFPLAVEPSIDIADVNVSRGGGQQTLLADFVNSTPGDGLTASGTALFCQANWGIRFPDGNAPANGEIITAQYSSYVPDNILRFDDVVQQGVMAEREGGDGVHEALLTMPNLRAQSIDPVNAMARIELSIYAPISNEISFRSYVKGWGVYQQIVVISDVHNYEKTMYVTSMTKRVITSYNEVGETVTEYSLSCRILPDVYA